MANDSLRNRGMKPIPQIQEPLPSRTDVRATTSISSRSRFNFLSLWRKPSNASLRSSTRADDEHAHQVPSDRHLGLRPALSPRSPSASAEPVKPDVCPGPDRRLERKRDKIVADPPPLAQAYAQAILHADLEAPTSYSERYRSRRNSLSSRDAASQDAIEDTIEVKRSHKRTDSGQSSCSTKSKSFFLINGPYVLQYDGDGEGSALPEKILVLDRDSVAFASDAVPGRPWVLQISRTSSSSTKSTTQSLRPSWSRFTLRQTETKRTVNTLLLVFKDSDELYTWLFAIRKEIEHLGGMEYRPDNSGDDQTWRENLTKKFASPSDSDRGSHISTTGPTISPCPSPQRSDPLQKANSQPSNRSSYQHSSASSKKTSTSSERLRDSGYSSTVATSNGETSTPLLPTSASFPSICSVGDRQNGGLSLRDYSAPSDNVGGSRQPLSTALAPSILERRNMSVNSLQLAQQEGNRGRKIVPNLPTTISRPPSEALPPLPSPSPNSPHAREVMSASDAGKTLEKTNCVRSNGHLPNKSVSDANSGFPKAKYSLFPVLSLADTKGEPLASPTAPTQPLAGQNSANPGKVKSSKSLRQSDKHQLGRNRIVTLELSQHRFSTLLAVSDLDLPQRSPAVTDDMIMANFGIESNDPPLSPMPDIKVPSLTDLEIDLDFLKSPYRAQQRKQSVLRDRKRVSDTRRASGNYNDASATLPKAPAGPPPSGPLPAVPQDSKSSSRSQQSSRYSQPSRGRKILTQSPVDDKQQVNIKAQTIVADRATYEAAATKSWHRKTISDSRDGPPPPTRSSSKTQQEQKSRSRSRSHSHYRKKAGHNPM